MLENQRKRQINLRLRSAFTQGETLNSEEVGSCNAIIAGIATKIDGSLKVTLEVNPEDQQIISNLLRLWAQNKRLITIGMIYNEENQ